MIIDPDKEPEGVIFILVRPNKQFLLMLRDENSRYFPNTWAFPGGACDKGEKHINACIREAAEEFEAQLKPEDCHLLMKRLNDHNWVYVCNVYDSVVLKQHEGKDMAWKSLNELKSLTLGYEQDDIIPILTKYLTRLGT